MDKHAYLLMIHENSLVLNRLIRLIDDNWKWRITWKSWQKCEKYRPIRNKTVCTEIEGIFCKKTQGVLGNK